MNTQKYMRVMKHLYEYLNTCKTLHELLDYPIKPYMNYWTTL